MAEVRINTEPRTEFGKGAARRTRRAGKIPAVLYGKGSEPVHLSLPALDFARALREHGRNAVLTLALSEGPQLALPKTVVTHPIRNYIEHVDLLVIKRGEKVVVEVSVTTVGEAGPDTLVTQELDRLLVEADVSNIPELIEVSVEGLQPGTQILAGQIRLPGGVNLRTDAEHLVVNVVVAPTAEALEGETTETEAAAEAEVAAEKPGEG